MSKLIRLGRRVAWLVWHNCYSGHTWNYVCSEYLGERYAIKRTHRCAVCGTLTEDIS